LNITIPGRCHFLIVHGGVVSGLEERVGYSRCTGLNLVLPDFGRGVLYVGLRTVDQFAVSRIDDVLFLRWQSGAQISHAMAVDAAASLRSLSDGRILPLVVVMGGIDGLTLKTRMGMNAYRGFSIVALIGDGPVDEVLAGFAHNSATPTRYFTSEVDAVDWIDDYTASDEEIAV
jgi:hypothetical protein